MPATEPTADTTTAPRVRRERRRWTPEEVHALGMTTDLETAAEILGISRTLAYELAKKNTFPVPLRRLGRRVLVSVPELLGYLGSTPTTPG